MKEDPKSEQNREPENKLSLDWDLKDIVKSKLRTKPTKGDCKFKQIKKKKKSNTKEKKNIWASIGDQQSQTANSETKDNNKQTQVQVPTSRMAWINKNWVTSRTTAPQLFLE